MNFYFIANYCNNFKKALSYKQLFHIQLFSLKINCNFNYDISHLFILLILI